MVRLDHPVCLPTNTKPYQNRHGMQDTVNEVVAADKQRNLFTHTMQFKAAILVPMKINKC